MAKASKFSRFGVYKVEIRVKCFEFNFKCVSGVGLPKAHRQKPKPYPSKL